VVGLTIDADAVDRVWVRDGVTPESGTASAVLSAKLADFHRVRSRKRQ
jgi:hypothetical protein